MEQDPAKHIANLLMTKSGIKQATYRNVCETFKGLKQEAHRIIDDINAKTDSKDRDITLSVTDVSEQEFHVKVAGDLLAFFLHTNIITLSDDYDYNKSEYVLEDPLRKYLGQINVYNFMADSLKYNRMHDPGYLVTRLLVNHENRFIVEGDRQINFLFEALSSKPIDRADWNVLVHLIITQAIENDLVAPPFHQIRGLTLQQKLASTEVVGAGHKIGFQMSSMKSNMD
jgi:hypothetical protein